MWKNYLQAQAHVPQALFGKFLYSRRASFAAALVLKLLPWVDEFSVVCTVLAESPLKYLKADQRHPINQ